MDTQPIADCVTACQGLAWLDLVRDWLPLAIAFVVAVATYVWQKQRDRKTAMLSEQRDAYRDFLADCIDLRHLVQAIAHDRDTYSSVEDAVNALFDVKEAMEMALENLSLIASQSVLDIAVNADGVLNEIITLLTSVVRDAQDDDGNGGSVAMDEAAAQEFDYTARRLLEIELLLISLVRAEQFGDDIGFQIEMADYQLRTDTDRVGFQPSRTSRHPKS